MPTKPVTPEEGKTLVFIDPRTKEPCRRCYGTGKMPPWPGSNGSVTCGVCRAEEGETVDYEAGCKKWDAPIHPTIAQKEDTNE